MTNEEKIAELINIRDKYNYTLAPREVFDDAIKALEAQPTDLTAEEKEIIDAIHKMGLFRTNYANDKVSKAVSKIIKAYEAQPTWIPVKDPLNELPKDRMLYVTTKYGDVETLFYDMTEWDDIDIARDTVAYMDYYKPSPYKEEEK